MRFKKVKLITLLLLAVLTIGAASAADDTNSLAVDDAGDEAVVEAPVTDEKEVVASVDEDVIEASESSDTLASPKAYFYDEVSSEYGTVVYVYDNANGINGTLTLFANDTQVYNQEVSSDSSVDIMANDIIGSFYGTYNMKVIYNGTDGTNFDDEGTVTFTKAIVNKVFTPDDFKVTFPASEIDIDKGDPVILTYFTPEGIIERSSYLFVYDGSRSYPHTFEMKLEDVGTYKNITWGDLYLYKTGVYNFNVSYSEDWENYLELGSATINVTNKHEYTAEEIIYIYDRVAMGEDQDCLAEIYDDEVEGLNGVVTAYANNVQIYTKTYSNYNRGGPIHAKDLKGSFNGYYTVRIVYKRADGKVFEISKKVYFDNVVGSDSIKTTLTALPTAVSMVYNANKAVVVTLKDANGKPISGKNIKVSVMGVSYNIVTNKNGQAKQSLSNLPPKVHTIAFAFLGDAVYKASSAKKVTVKVVKAAQKITAKAKTFKRADKKKLYSVALNHKQKVKVTIKVGKVKASAYTNKKGVATFKLAKLAKGKYTASIVSAANTCYKAGAAKVKITVK